MLLSEIGSRAEAEEVYGVVCDTADFFPPDSLKRVSFVARADAGDLDYDMLDVAIAYKGAGISVIFEIPADFAVPVEKVLARATALDVDLALVPPADGLLTQAYLDQVEEYARRIGDYPSWSKSLYPVTDCIGAFIAARLGVRSSIFPLPGPGNDLVSSKFVEPDAARRIGLAARKGLETSLGGPAELEEYLDRHVREVYDLSDAKAAEMVKRYEIGAITNA